MAKLVKTKTEWEGHQFEERSIIEDNEPAPWPDNAHFKAVGIAQPRIDGAERVSGRANYTYDIQLPGMLYARVLRSPYPHARIRRLDTGNAAGLPGVRAIISYKDTADVSWEDERIFNSVLRFAGDEIAAIAADSEETAEDALQLIRADYEILPFVTDAGSALLPGAPAVKPEGNLIGKPKLYKRGDTQKGFIEADVIVENTFSTQPALHNCLESHGAVAQWNGDELTVWESTQSIQRVREDLAEAFKLPLNKVRVICEFMGGGFGSKQSTGKWSFIAALLARKTARPVQLMLDRREENLAAGNRAPSTQFLKIGAKRDGTLTAIELEAFVNVGVYLSLARAIDGPCQVMYACPNVTTGLRSVLTNTGPQRSFRGPGFVEGAFPLESLMDDLANRLDIDPIAIRMKNYAASDQRTNQKYSAKYLDKCYKKGSEMIGWKVGRLSEQVSENVRRGLGMASQTWGGGGGPPAYAWVRLNSDGTAEVITGSQDIGTGTRTAFAQITAEELGIQTDRIRVQIGDTANGPYDPVSWGSMSISSVGPAVRQAALDARNQLYEIISRFYQVPPVEVRLKGPDIYIEGEAKPRGNLTGLFQELGNFTVLGKGARRPNPSEVALRTFGAQFAKVDVNISTGEVKVLNMVTVTDNGRVINKLGASNQVRGAVVQGIGYALTEERVIDSRTGIVLNPNLENYMVPTALDFMEIDHDFINIPDSDSNNIGAKGLGEQALIPTAPAIANAIANAIGIRFLSLPITRDKILDALRNHPKKTWKNHEEL
jgi:CO/xanthine dehydrogenase Mo-binding subunit